MGSLSNGLGLTVGAALKLRGLRIGGSVTELQNLCLFLLSGVISRKPRNFISERRDFYYFLLAVTLHQSVTTLPNNAQIDGFLPRSNVVKSVYEYDIPVFFVLAIRI